MSSSIYMVPHAEHLSLLMGQEGQLVCWSDSSLLLVCFPRHHSRLRANIHLVYQWVDIDVNDLYLLLLDLFMVFHTIWYVLLASLDETLYPNSLHRTGHSNYFSPSTDKLCLNRSIHSLRWNTPSQHAKWGNTFLLITIQTIWFQ